MDDLNFRRRIYADPNDHAQDIQDACAEDLNKAKFRQEMQQFDQQIKTALETPVPDNLAERIMLGQSLANQQKEKRKSRVHLALAASIAFAIGISLQISGVSPRYESLSDHAIAHLTDEISHIPSTAGYTREQLNTKLASFGGQLTQDIAPIKFANFCRFDGTRSLHLVLAGEHGDVTVFVVPKDANLAVSPTFSNLEYIGKTLSFANANVVVVTGKKQEPVGEWSKKLDSAIQWQKI